MDQLLAACAARWLQQDRMRREHGDQSDDNDVGGEARRGDVAVPVGAVGEVAAGQNAHCARAEVGGQCDVGGGEQKAVAAHQRADAETADASVGEAEQHEEDHQHDDRRRQHAL